MRTWLDRLLTGALAVLLVASLVGVAYLAVDPPETTDPYTEFYVLGPGGNASGYPTNLSAGETGTVVVGVANHEHRDLRYRIVVTWNDTKTGERTVRVPDEETREVEVALVAPAEPGRYEVRLLLYRGDATGEPYRWLRLLITVRE